MQSEQEDGKGSRRWHFGSAVFDERAWVLEVAGRTVDLNKKPLQVLQCLLEHAGATVTQEKLIQYVWLTPHKAPATLTKAIASLRSALGDRDRVLIQTRSGDGYTLAVPVRCETVDAPAPRLGHGAGDHPALRPLWTLVERLGGGGQGELWLARHDETRETRVYKFGLYGTSLKSLKREITLNRRLHDDLGDKASVFVQLLGSNLEQAPFFVEMEYLPAGSLSQWADRQGGCDRIPQAVRLELAAQIADALGLAHSAGVVHKDLKPGNVLIDDSGGSGTPVRESSPPSAGSNAPRIKLCDFGSGGLQDRARLEDGGIAPLGFTATIGLNAANGGTPMYLAPEVLGGERAGMQADMYSLGVLLYQLITGDLKKPLAPRWERNIQDELLREDIAALVDGEPELRSRDATEVARRIRSLDTRREERARQRRNEQEAGRLREELERLGVRRQWLLALAGVLALGLLVVGLLLMQVERAREEAQEQSRRAESEAATAATVNEFLLDDLLGQASPLDSGKVDLRVREVLDLAAGSASRRFANEPDRERAIRLAVGKAYLQLGNYREAEKELLAALALTPESDQQQRALIDFYLGDTLAALDRRDEASTALSRAAIQGDAGTKLLAAVQLAGLRSLYDDDHAAALSELLSLRPRLEAQFGAGHPNLDNLISDLTDIHHNLGRYKEAVVLARELVDRLQERHGGGDPREIIAQISLGTVLCSAEEYEESLQVLTAVLPRAQTALGENHLQTFAAVNDLAMAHAGLGRTDKALALLEPAFETLRSRYGVEHFETLRALNSLGAVYHQRGEFGRYVALLEPHFATLKQERGESAEDTLILMSNLAVGYAETGSIAKAEAMQARAMDLARESIPDHWLTGAIALDHAQSLVRLGRFEQADAIFDEATRRLTKAVGEDDSRVAVAREKHDAMRKRWTADTQDRRL
ncbi:MAG: tetratricopeptide repeat protein [Panacagrimonas sp.]